MPTSDLSTTTGEADSDNEAGALRVGSLFSGIGGLDLGFERAGFKIAWQCEKDSYCQKVLNKHWPNTPCYDNIEHLHRADGPQPDADILIGGFPCQDISLAGEGAGLDGDRSGLWWEYCRLIRSIRPRYAIVENVPALVRRGLRAVLGALAESGYDAEWQIVSAAAFGAPHLRERLFLVAYPSRLGCNCSRGARRCVHHRDGYSTRKVWREPQQQSRPSGYREGTGTTTDADSTGRQEQHATTEPSWSRFDPGALGRRRLQWRTEPNVGRVANGVPDRVDRIRGLGNAVVPQVAEYVAECVKEHAERTRDPRQESERLDEDVPTDAQLT